MLTAHYTTPRNGSINQSVSEALQMLREAVNALADAKTLAGIRGIRDATVAIEAYEQAAKLALGASCDASEILLVARREADELRRSMTPPSHEPEPEPQPSKAKPVKCPPASDVAGGTRQTALRSASGHCQICSAEHRLTYHHIVPREEGGQDDPANLIVLCRECHDEVELCDYRTRGEVLGHTPQRRVRLSLSMEKSESRVITMPRRVDDSKVAAQLKADRALLEWGATWDSWLDGTVQWHHKDDPPLRRPEKRWHVLVYGSGHLTKSADDSELAD